MFDFSDKVAIITGAGGNLGAAVARAFANAGAHVVLVDRAEGRLEEVLPALAGSRDHLLMGGIDLTQPQDVQKLVEAVMARLGRIDVLVNAAGGFRAGGPVHKMPLETLDFMFNLNTRTVFIASQAVIPHMLEQGSGKIVNVAAKKALEGAKNQSAYSVSKSGVVRLTESMANELRASGINVNCVLPNVIDTPENREGMPDANFEQWVTPESLADVILFLASDAARDVHGASVPVYGRS